jgi:hypothetical protein
MTPSRSTRRRMRTEPSTAAPSRTVSVVSSACRAWSISHIFHFFDASELLIFCLFVGEENKWSWLWCEPADRLLASRSNLFVCASNSGQIMHTSWKAKEALICFRTDYSRISIYSAIWKEKQYVEVNKEFLLRTIRTKSSEAGSLLFGIFFGFTFDSFKVSTLLLQRIYLVLARQWLLSIFFDDYFSLSR